MIITRLGKGMSIIRGVIVLTVIFALYACEVVNHYTVKLTSSAEMQGSEIHLPITTGHIYLSTQQLTEKDKEILQSILPFQCLKITTSEPFDMKNRTVHFQNFKFKKLPIGDSECRKIKVGTRISATF